MLAGTASGSARCSEQETGRSPARPPGATRRDKAPREPRLGRSSAPARPAPGGPRNVLEAILTRKPADTAAQRPERVKAVRAKPGIPKSGGHAAAAPPGLASKSPEFFELGQGPARPGPARPTTPSAHGSEALKKPCTSSSRTGSGPGRSPDWPAGRPGKPRAGSAAEGGRERLRAHNGQTN
jgi:hypothetical protein